MSIGTRIISLIGSRQRVYAVFAPDGAATPYAVWQMISAAPLNTHEAVSSITAASVQIACYSSTMASAIAVRADIINAVEGNHADGPISVAGLRDSYEDEAKLYRADVDLTVWDGS